MQLSEKMYNVLKRLAMVWIPAVGTLYGALAATVGLPNPAAVIGVLTAVDAFLGVMLGVSTSMYNAKAAAAAKDISGIITVTQTADGGRKFSFNFAKELPEIEQLAVAHFKVQRGIGAMTQPTAPPAAAAVEPLDGKGRGGG